MSDSTLPFSDRRIGHIVRKLGRKCCNTRSAFVETSPSPSAHSLAHSNETAWITCRSMGKYEKSQGRGTCDEFLIIQDCMTTTWFHSLASFPPQDLGCDYVSRYNKLNAHIMIDDQMTRWACIAVEHGFRGSWFTATSGMLTAPGFLRCRPGLENLAELWMEKQTQKHWRNWHPNSMGVEIYIYLFSCQYMIWTWITM